MSLNGNGMMGAIVYAAAIMMKRKFYDEYRDGPQQQEEAAEETAAIEEAPEETEEVSQKPGRKKRGRMELSLEKKRNNRYGSLKKQKGRARIRSALLFAVWKG